jgi:hypothetical protein
LKEDFSPFCLRANFWHLLLCLLLRYDNPTERGEFLLIQRDVSPESLTATAEGFLAIGRGDTVPITMFFFFFNLATDLGISKNSLPTYARGCGRELRYINRWTPRRTLAH